MNSSNPLDIPEILKRLENLEPGVFPREALEAASARHDEIVPHLLAILEDAIQRVGRNEDCPDWMAPTYAMYLLAEFREPRAIALLVRLVSAPREDVEGVLGESFTEGLDRVLAALCETDARPLVDLAANGNADEYVRWNALDAMVHLVALGFVERAMLVALLQQLLRTPTDLDESAVWAGIACACSDIHPGEFMADLKTAYEEGRVDDTVIRFQDLEADAKRPLEETMAELREKTDPAMESAIREMEDWYCFQSRAQIAEELETPVGPQPVTPIKEPPQSYSPATPHQRPSPKTGRNDRCPCGSGRKFKKCCGAV